MPLKIHSKEFYSNYIFHPLSEELSAEDKTKALTASVCVFIFSLGIFPLCCYIKYMSKKYTINSEQTVDQKIKRTTGSSFQAENTGVQQPKSQGRFSKALTEKEVYEEMEKVLGEVFKNEPRYQIDFAKISKNYLKGHPDLGKSDVFIEISKPPSGPKDDIWLDDLQFKALGLYLVLTDKVESFIHDRASYKLGSMEGYRKIHPQGSGYLYTKMDGKLVRKDFYSS